MAKETFITRAEFLTIKRQYPNMILLFVVGDFLEAFYEDADVVSRELGLILVTSLLNDQKMSGFPIGAAETEAKKLFDKGYTLAIVEKVRGGQHGL